jgi:hypothetical protein
LHFGVEFRITNIFPLYTKEGICQVFFKIDFFAVTGWQFERKKEKWAGRELFFAIR